MINRIFTNIKTKWEQRNIFLEKFTSMLKEYSFIIKPFFYIAVIFIVGIIAIIRANFNYIDDLKRVAEGYVGWESFSRYASSFLSRFIHADSYLTDISPIPQLLAACIMAVSGAIILYVYKNEKKFSFWDIIAIIPLGLSPYFLECFSYKYDAPYMAISVLASVVPLLFRKKKSLVYPIVTILCTLLMCMTYQAASGIFLMFVILICLKNWNKGESLKENLKFLIISVVNYLIALLIYKFFIMQPANNYVSNAILPIGELLSGSLQHLKKYFSFIISDFRKEWLILIGAMAISFIYVFARDSKKKKYISLIVSIIALGMMALLSFGMYPVLEKPLFQPRAMYGFGAFIAFMGVTIAASPKAYLPKIIVFILSWMFFVFAFTYGNALEVQGEYTDFRVNLVIEDLNDLEIFTKNEKKTVQISGTIGQSPIIENMPKDYKILERLVPILFREEWDWGKYYFYNYFDLKNVVEKDGQDFTTLNLPILTDTMYHTIRGDNTRILIELK